MRSRSPAARGAAPDDTGANQSSGDALISACGRYRYTLTREWGTGPQACWIMLNPSTADAFKDDATICVVVGRSRRAGWGSLVIVNLFAYRATEPKALRSAADPVGPENDVHIAGAVRRAAVVVVAWGTQGAYLGRDRAVLGTLIGRELLSVGRTKDGHPRHPLRNGSALCAFTQERRRAPR